MTSIEFRQSSERVAAFRTLLNDPVLAAAVVVIKEEPFIDAAPGSDAIVSVRLLSSGAQRDQVVNTFLSLAEPLPPEPPPEVESFGVDLSKFEAPPK